MPPQNNLVPFQPAIWARGGHLQTIVGYYLPSPVSLNNTIFHKIKLDERDNVVVCENHPERDLQNKIIVLAHGLGGEADSRYMKRVATAFLEHGWIVFRMNHRGCGRGQGLAWNLYNAGSSSDIAQVLGDVAKMYPSHSLVVIGFSLSGNAVLKLLGEHVHPLPGNLCGAIAVAPPIDLSLCADAISEKRNWIYERRFILMLRDAIRERTAAFSDFPNFPIPWQMTLREFDEIYTAPLSGFNSSADYYQQCSAKQFLPNLSLPAILLASDNDPFIPRQTYEDISATDFFQAHIIPGGGHMGFVASQNTPLGSRHWMDYALLNFAEEFVRSYSKAY